MMGHREGGQGQFFYSFDLDEVVPADQRVGQYGPAQPLRQLGRSLPLSAAPRYFLGGRNLGGRTLLSSFFLVHAPRAEPSTLPGLVRTKTPHRPELRVRSGTSSLTNRL